MWKISPHEKGGENLPYGEISPHKRCGENMSNGKILLSNKEAQGGTAQPTFLLLILLLDLSSPSALQNK